MDPSEKSPEELISDRTYETFRSDSDPKKVTVRALRLTEELCLVCGGRLAYLGALYCGAACSALDHA